MAGSPDITVVWRALRPLSAEPRDNLWDATRCLYAYVAPDHELLYVGLAWNHSVAARWDADDKIEGFWSAVARERRIRSHATIQGTVIAHGFGRVTRELLEDVESLLIVAEKPWGNIRNRETRLVCRPGLVVHCKGSWPGAYSRYTDPGPIR